MRSTIPRRVQEFIGAHLRSITQLDLLLVLHAAPGHAFTSAELSAQLKVPERFVTALLVDFAGADIVATDADAATWRFHASGPHARVIDDLAACVQRRKRSVHDLILSGPAGGDIQSFSDAFRLRRRD